MFWQTVSLGFETLAISKLQNELVFWSFAINIKFEYCVKPNRKIAVYGFWLGKRASLFISDRETPVSIISKSHIVLKLCKTEQKKSCLRLKNRQTAFAIYILLKELVFGSFTNQIATRKMLKHLAVIG